MYFSKSKYCLYRQCPKLLWLEQYHPELKQEDTAREDRLTAGNQVGDLAMGLFGAFTETTVLEEDGRPNISAMLEMTRQCIHRGVETICEAAFRYRGLYCAVDILRKEKGGYAIYEVKSATRAAPIYNADIAYQKYVLEHCGITVTGTYLVCINADYVRSGELDLQDLFRVVDVSDSVASEYGAVERRLSAAEETLALKEEPVQAIGAHCRDPYRCAYWKHCTRHLPSPSVFDLYGIRFRKALEYYRKGLVSFSDLSAVPSLTPAQRRQIRHALCDLDSEIDREGLRTFLRTLSYPVYFFDFETMQQQIPQYPGCKPYTQIPFQYSLHHIEAPGGKLQHREFLAVSGTDPRRAIAESICQDIPRDVCVLAYNSSFECSCLKALAEQFPDLAPHLLNVRSNIRDLLVPFRSGYCYNRAMGGSFSIKCVLPALFPDDPELDYHNLEGIHNGSEAMSVFPKIREMAPEEAAEVRKNLLAYCKLDTYALVKIWEKLIELSH